MDVLYIVMKEEPQYFFIKNIYVILFFREGLNLCSVWERETNGDKDRPLYWPITSSLDHTTRCYLQDSYFALLLLLSSGYSTRSPLWALLQQGALRDCKLELTQESHCPQLTQTISWASVYIISSRSRPVQRNFWLMARSRVKMQQMLLVFSASISSFSFFLFFLFFLCFLSFFFLFLHFTLAFFHTFLPFIISHFIIIMSHC